jgi:hypothetical protein
MGVKFVELADDDRNRIREVVDRMYTAGRQHGDATLRRSARVLVNIPVKVASANGGQGVPLDADAAIVRLSKNGGCIATTHPVGVGGDAAPAHEQRPRVPGRYRVGRGTRAPGTAARSGSNAGAWPRRSASSSPRL